MRDVGVALSQDLAHQPVEGLGQGGVGNVALVLVEFAGDEVAVPFRDRLLQRMDQRGFADPRIAGHCHQHGCARRGHCLERAQQCRFFLLASVQLGRDPETVGHISHAQRKRRNLSSRLPLVQALVQVGQKPAGALVPLFRHLGQQLQHEVRDHLGNVGDQLMRRNRHAGEMAMHPFQRIVRLERQLSGQQAIQQDAQRIEIGAVIDRTIHAAGLLGRSIRPVGSSSRTERGCPLERSGPAQVCQFHLDTIMCQQEVGGAQIVMHDAGGMERPQGAGKLASNGKRYRQGETLLARQYGVQALAGEGFQDQGQACAVFLQGKRMEDLGHIKGLQQGILVPQAVTGALACGELEEDGGVIMHMTGEVECAAGCRADLLNDLIVACIHLLPCPRGCMYRLRQFSLASSSPCIIMQLAIALFR